MPVDNEEVALRPSVHRLHAFLAEHLPCWCCITVADNASTDATWAEALLMLVQRSGLRIHEVPVDLALRQLTAHRR